MIDNFKRIVKEDFNMSVKISAFEIENVKITVQQYAIIST